MTFIKTLRAGLLGASCLALGACFGSSGGGALVGGGGSAGSIAEFDATFSELSSGNGNFGATSTKLSGTGNFSGSAKLELIEVADQNNRGFALGDLRVQADFDNNTISGQASNFRGEMGGEEIILTGTLDTANGLVAPTLTSETLDLTALPGAPVIPGAPTSVVTTGFNMDMGGQLADEDGTIGNVNLGLSGFFGAPVGQLQATGAAGAASVVVSHAPTTNASPISIAGSGTFYIERD